MKKTIIATLLILISVIGFSQEKKDTGYFLVSYVFTPMVGQQQFQSIGMQITGRFLPQKEFEKQIIFNLIEGHHETVNIQDKVMIVSFSRFRNKKEYETFFSTK